MKLNKKGDMEILSNQIIFLIIAVLVFAGLFWYVSGLRNAAWIWEEYYSKEIVNVINLGERGDKLEIDVTKATSIAKKNEVRSFSEVFTFDNSQNDFCVKLSQGGKSCYKWFNDLDVVELDIKFGVGNEGGNILIFKLVEADREVKDE